VQLSRVATLPEHHLDLVARRDNFWGQSAWPLQLVAVDDVVDRQCQYVDNTAVRVEFGKSLHPPRDIRLRLEGVGHRPHVSW
jgi:hypothetical protein